jgi:hypothetical protein
MRRWLGWSLFLGICVSSVGCGSGQGEDGSTGIDSGGDLDAPTSDTASADTSLEIDSSAADTSDVTDTAPTLDSAASESAAVDSSAVDSPSGDTSSADTSSAMDTSPAIDSSTDTKPLDSGADTGSWTGTAHVHVYISNTCEVSTSPTSFDVPAGKTLKISWHNHSVDYRADLWGSYGGGYLMLEKGATWNEPYEHCFIKSTHTEYMDVTPEGSPSACGKFRLNITCHAP